MTVRFYMNDEGHVLDNEKFPVTHPMLVRPVFRRAPLVMREPISEHCHFETEVFHAYTLKSPR